ncbi:MAG TPA: sulfotransferase domain-containing protein [Candidatus Limnocylindrales bacterium]|nr:sulfotransferase domain-containing protein [Candidatus Limnocylindrales bacterium]
MIRYKTFIFDSSRWDGFRFRQGDIVISTPPKAGTTWTQRICALLIFQTPELSAPLTTLSPWIDMLTRPHADVIADLERQTHRRFIKTHTPLDGIPFDDRVTYICVARDPRDVALSWDNHIANADFGALLGARDRAVGNADIADMIENGPPPQPETEQERFWAWVSDETPPQESPSTLLATINHLQTFWKVRDLPNVILLHYDALKDDLEGEMRRLAARLGITVPEALWPSLVDAATFEQMKRAADRTAPGVTESIWQDNSKFFNRGTSGQWRSLLTTAEDQARYEARVRSLADAALASWAHHGRLGR